MANNHQIVLRIGVPSPSFSRSTEIPLRLQKLKHQMVTGPEGFGLG